MQEYTASGVGAIIVTVLSIAAKYGYQLLKDYLDKHLEMMNYEMQKTKIEDIVNEAINFVEEFCRANQKFPDSPIDMSSVKKQDMALDKIKNKLSEIGEELSDDGIKSLLFSQLNKMRK